MIAALYVETGGIYFGRPDVEPWDGTPGRDAREYPGPHPVVAHPPCQRWGKLWWTARHHGKGVGDDDGCFEAALEALREWGGILEHPAYSKAYAHFGLAEPGPARGRWLSTYRENEWVTAVFQRNYGHRALKETWLYAVGPRPPDMDWGPPERPTAWVSTDRPLAELHAMGVEMMGAKERKATPPAFAEYLLNYARMCN